MEISVRFVTRAVPNFGPVRGSGRTQGVQFGSVGSGETAAEHRTCHTCLYSATCEHMHQSRMNNHDAIKRSTAHALSPSSQHSASQTLNAK